MFWGFWNGCLAVERKEVLAYPYSISNYGLYDTETCGGVSHHAHVMYLYLYSTFQIRTH